MIIHQNSFYTKNKTQVWFGRHIHTFTPNCDEMLYGVCKSVHKTYSLIIFGFRIPYWIERVKP